jgi:hypothetical protein
MADSKIEQQLQAALEAAQEEVAQAQRAVDEVEKLYRDRTETLECLDRQLALGASLERDLVQAIARRGDSAAQADGAAMALRARQARLRSALEARDEAQRALAQQQYSQRLEDLRAKDAEALEQLMVAVRACAARGASLQQQEAQQLHETGRKAGLDPVRGGREQLIVTDNLADKLAEIVSDEFRRARHRPFNFAPSPVATEVSHG